MRIFLALSMMLLLASCQNAETVTSTAVEVDETEAVEKMAVVANANATFQVDGMMCEVGCKGTIEKALNGTQGVKECQVDFEKAQATVEFDSLQINTEDLAGIINTLADGHYQATLL